MKGRTGYFMIAILLTFLNVAVTVYSGVMIWTACPRDIWDCELSVALAALGTTSLLNLWVQALAGSVDSLGGRTIESGHGATRIPTEARGSGNV